MLFPYRYVPHSIEKLQKYIDFLFLHVWCQAERKYTIEKLDGCPDLKEIVLAIYYDGRIHIDHLYGPIEEIFNIFKILSRRKRKALRRWYTANNSIEKLCANESGYRGKHYKELEGLHEKLSQKLKWFFTNLWKNVLDLKAVQEKVGNIREHYIAFMTENDDEMCPFCGLNDLEGVYLSKRDAYDHYLPKGTYPFISINFKNLAPMCHECNSSYKGEQNPLYVLPHRDPLRSKENHRRKAFYPYSKEQVDFEVSLSLNSRDIQGLTPDAITLGISADNHQEEVETWMEIFGIEERFKEKSCKKNVGKKWVQSVTDEVQNVRELTGVDISTEQWLSKIKAQCQQDPWHERNFLKKAFLEACEQSGVFEDNGST